jgi:hypothetical protein
VLAVAGNAVIVRGKNGNRKFTLDDVSDHNISIMKDGKPVELSQLRVGDKLTATIITVPVVLTESSSGRAPPRFPRLRRRLQLRLWRRLQLRPRLPPPRLRLRRRRLKRRWPPRQLRWRRPLRQLRPPRPLRPRSLPRRVSRLGVGSFSWCS